MANADNVEMADSKKVSVGTKEQKMEFEIPQPYTEGHTINPIEAKVLNQVYAENVCNNMRAKVQATIKGEKAALNEKDLREAFNKYASEYVFTEAAAGTGKGSMTPLERKARAIATNIVIALLAKPSEQYPKGRKRKDVEKEAFEAEVARIAEADKVQKAAAKALKEEENLATSVLEAA